MTTEPAPNMPVGGEPLPVSRVRRSGIPARVRIMGWLILLMAVVLLSVGVVSRNLLLRQVEEMVNTALGQEAKEFSGVAGAGVDRATGRPFRDVHELLHNHLQRQFADDDEVLVGAVRSGTDWQILRQDRVSPLALHERRDLLDPILASPDATGRTDTEAGEMGWAKVVVTSPDEPGTSGVFVVGYFIDRDRAEVDRTIQTLALVSLLGLVLTAAASWLIAGRILSPVRLVNTAAAQITEQDLTRRIPVEGHDEFTTLAAQFNAMLDRLERAFATQRDFLDDASHELRTPITIIRGHLELLDPVSSDPDERTAVMRICTDELDRMSRMVDDLLLLAKSERPDFLRPQGVELAELTSDIHAKIRALGDRQWRLTESAKASSPSTRSASPRPWCSWRTTRCSTPPTGMRSGSAPPSITAGCRSGSPTTDPACHRATPGSSSSGSPGAAPLLSPATAAAPGSAWPSCAPSPRRTTAT